MVGEYENHRDAGVRELLDETGYQGQSVKLLGKLLWNPSIQSNVIWATTAISTPVAGARHRNGHSVISFFVPLIRAY
jgi:hypothetical protein